jgi:hypothetical protein
MLVGARLHTVWETEAALTIEGGLPIVIKSIELLVVKLPLWLLRAAFPMESQSTELLPG